MSDHYLFVIPTDPTFVPDASAQQGAMRLAMRAFPNVDKIVLEQSERIEFVFALGNYEAPSCPFCGSDLDHWFWTALDQWAKRIDTGRLTVTLPCCRQPGSLNDLAYGDFPQGFARFQLPAMNANIGWIGSDLLLQFEGVLGCPVRVVYRRL